MEQIEIIAGEQAGGRLDAWLATQCDNLSRSAVQTLIEQGLITESGRPVNKKDKVRPGSCYWIQLPDPQPIEAVPQPIPFSVVYEDADLIVVDKPKGMVVHRRRAIRTGRWSMRCCIIARGSFPGSEVPFGLVLYIGLIRIPAVCWLWPKMMRPIRR